MKWTVVPVTVQTEVVVLENATVRPEDAVAVSVAVWPTRPAEGWPVHVIV